MMKPLASCCQNEIKMTAEKSVINERIHRISPDVFFYFFSMHSGLFYLFPLVYALKIAKYLANKKVKKSGR